MREIKAESVDAQLAQLETGSGSPVELALHRRDLEGVDALLAQAPWEDREPDEAVELVGRQALLSRLIHGVLLYASSQIDQACYRRLREGFSIDEIADWQRRLTAVLGLPRAVGLGPEQASEPGSSRWTPASSR